MAICEFFESVSRSLSRPVCPTPLPDPNHNPHIFCSLYFRMQEVYKCCTSRVGTCGKVSHGKRCQRALLDHWDHHHHWNCLFFQVLVITLFRVLNWTTRWLFKKKNQNDAEIVDKTMIDIAAPCKTTLLAAVKRREWGFCDAVDHVEMSAEECRHAAHLRGRDDHFWPFLFGQFVVLFWSDLCTKMTRLCHFHFVVVHLQYELSCVCSISCVLWSTLSQQEYVFPCFLLWCFDQKISCIFNLLVVLVPNTATNASYLGHFHFLVFQSKSCSCFYFPFGFFVWSHHDNKMIMVLLMWFFKFWT